MRDFLKACMIILSGACALWIMFPFLTSATMPAAANDGEASGRALAAGCCFFGSLGTGGIVWVIGMVPLCLLYLCCGKPEKPPPPA